MNSKFIHILFFILGQVIFALSQNTMPDWEIKYGGDSSILFIEVDTLVIDGETVKEGDYLGAFTNERGTEICLGYTVWQANTRSMDYYFDSDTTYGGAVIGDSIYFKHWSLINNCTYNETFVTRNTESVSISYDTLYNYNIYSSNLVADITYKDSYDTSVDSITPVVITTGPYTYAVESSDSLNTYQFVKIDSLSGLITADFVEDIGAFQVDVTSDVCIEPLTFVINITNTPYIIQESPFLEEEDLYLAPFSENEDYHTILIEGEDEIQIFDKSGRLIISSNGSFDWDGKDRYGNALPSDDYYIKVGDKVRIITVLN